jgi:cell division protein FtsQ
MWNNTRLLNLLANVMFGMAALIVLKLAVIAFINSPRFPVHTVRISGDLAGVAADQLSDAFAGRPMGNFFSVDLAAVRQWVEEVPWVRRATVRRAWPDRLDVRIEAQHALARWAADTEPSGRGQLVNIYGELFGADTDAQLPLLSGPAGTEKDVAVRYRRFYQLLAPLQQQPVEVTLTQRFAWEVRLSGGLLIALGRDGPHEDAQDRLARFVRMYPATLARLGPRVAYVDLRYPNGFALRLPDMPRFLKDDDSPGPAGSPREHKLEKSAGAQSTGRAPGPA